MAFEIGSVMKALFTSPADAVTHLFLDSGVTTCTFLIGIHCLTAALNATTSCHDEASAWRRTSSRVMGSKLMRLSPLRPCWPAGAGVAGAGLRARYGRHRRWSRCRPGPGRRRAIVVTAFPSTEAVTVARRPCASRVAMDEGPWRPNPVHWAQHHKRGLLGVTHPTGGERNGGAQVVDAATAATSGNNVLTLVSSTPTVSQAASSAVMAARRRPLTVVRVSICNPIPGCDRPPSQHHRARRLVAHGLALKLPCTVTTGTAARRQSAATRRSTPRRRHRAG